MSKRTSIRIPLELYTWLEQRAKVEKRTISNLIVYLLEHSRADSGASDRTPPDIADYSASKRES